MLERLPARYRAELRPLLPERAFLRRCRGRGLFVTDAPRYGDLTPALTAAGFLWEPEGNCLILSPDAARVEAVEADFPAPPDLLCASLARLRGLPACTEAVECFAVGARLLEASVPEERLRYRRRVRQLAAVCLRTRQGGAYACALVLATLSRKEQFP